MSRDTSITPILRGLALDLVPIFSVVFLILTITIPTSLPQVTTIGGIWPLLGIAYWTLARPRSMPVLTVFMLGLLTDIVTFVPFGIHALAFAVARATLVKQRRFLMGQGFWMLWAAYAVLAFAIYTVLFAMTSLFMPASVSYLPGLLGICLGWACVPPMIWVLSRLHFMMNLFDEPAL